ncbi:MAG: helix-turn-helix transcriptional regulator [Alphaproteobacteria bacterium]|nr:helix-turn-helix transcriptional regulator [Alphaproteobacteria bacterium]
MISFIDITPHETLRAIARQAQEKRLSLNFTQQTLSRRSGVSFGVVKKFECTGKISLESLLKIALALDSLLDFQNLFKPTSLEHGTLDELMSDKTSKEGLRKRGRQ